jgi:succinate dehydrogenase / fumarate reductase membrane anchor subunit
MNLRTPIARARGLGSAKEGVGHWWAQRVTAAALVPLALWFAVSMVSVARADYMSAVEWIGRPFNTAMLVLFLATTFHHAQLGLQVVIEDYVHHEGAKIASLMAMKFVVILWGVAAIIAVLRIAFGG